MTNPWFILDESFTLTAVEVRKFNPNHTAILPNKALSFRKSDPKILPEPLDVVRGLYLDYMTASPYYEAQRYLEEVIRRHLEWESNALAG